MVKQLDTINKQVKTIIIYLNSKYLEYFLRTKLRDNYRVVNDCVLDVSTSKAIKEAKLDSLMAPPNGENWLINVNADKLSKKDLLNSLSLQTAKGVTVYWTEKYMTYRTLVDSKEVKNLGVFCNDYTFTRLKDYELLHIYSSMMADSEYRLEPKLLDFVCKNYTYDIEDVFRLFLYIKQGGEVQSRKDVIAQAGIGGNTVSSATLRILQTTVISDKSRKNALVRSLKLIEDLQYTHSWETVRNYMVNTVRGFIEMKQLHMMGIYGFVGEQIPEGFDSKRLGRLRRFERAVIRELSMTQLINFDLLLSRNYDPYNPELTLLKAISEYIDSLATVDKKPNKRFVKKR